MQATRMRMAAGGVSVPALWTPSTPTTGGGVSPHTWQVWGVETYQDAAKTTVAAVTDPVGAMVNQGSDTYDIVQATADNRPTLQQVTINSVTSYIGRFDGANDFLQGAFGGGAISQPYTLFSVAKLATGAASDGITHQMLDGDNAGNRMILTKGAGGVFSMNAGTGLTAGAANENWIIWAALFNGGSSQLWLNGVSVASGNAGTNVPDAITIGASLSGTGPWKGDIGQILIYPGNLSTADKNQVGEYLELATGIVWTTIT